MPKKNETIDRQLDAAISHRWFDKAHYEGAFAWLNRCRFDWPRISKTSTKTRSLFFASRGFVSCSERFV
jgi:hypothetical protein